MDYLASHYAPILTKFLLIKLVRVDQRKASMGAGRNFSRNRSLIFVYGDALIKHSHLCMKFASCMRVGAGSNRLCFVRPKPEKQIVLQIFLVLCLNPRQLVRAPVMRAKNLEHFACKRHMTPLFPNSERC